MNERRDNAVLVCHALSGSARVADWWPEMFGSVFDLSRDCVICINILGSCYGSTGPTSIDPAPASLMGRDFPLVTIRDMVRAQAHVLDHLGVERLHIVIGARSAACRRCSGRWIIPSASSTALPSAPRRSRPWAWR